VINKFDIYFPTELKLIGDYLLFVDMKADKMIKIINLKTNEIVKSFGSKGQGPSEFIGISQIIPDIKDDNTFWVYDFTTKYLKKFNMNKILNNYFYPEEIIRIQSEKSGSPYQLMFTPDDKIIGIGLFFKGRISIYDRSGIYIKSIGKIPVVLKNEKFTPQHSHGFQGKFIFRDKSKEIFIAVRLGTIIERYSMDGNLISTLYGPEVFFPEYKIVPAGQSYTMTYNKKSRFGYIDIYYNKRTDKIFLLYSGGYQFGTRNRKATFGGNIIYVLDNKETIIEQIELDKEIFTMEISDDGSTIFGLSGEEILKFKL
jgi:hypothetical protein